MATRTATPYYRALSIAQPAVGAELVIRPAGSGLWRVISVVFVLVTDANVANREVSLVADDGTSEFFIGTANAVQAAGATVRYSAASGVGAGGSATGARSIALPTDGMYLEPGWRLRTDTDVIQVGDQYSAIVALAQEYPTGPEDYWVPGSAVLTTREG